MTTSFSLQIPEPCHEKWHNMTPKEQGRFCGSCQKIVVDFSVMTDKEVLDYISNASQRVCGRFSHDQLNKDLKKTEYKKRFSWAYFWNLLLATFLITETKAQGEPVIKKKPAVQQMDLLPRMGTIAVVEKPAELAPPIEINGTVVDIDSKPIAGASVYVKSTSTGTVSDTLGNFHLRVQKGDTVIISYVGYKTQTLVVDSDTNWPPIKVRMIEYSVTLGMVYVQQKVPKKEKVKRVINNWTPAAIKKDIKIYPNPIVRGNVIQADLSLKQAGEYKMELLDVRGRVVTVQKLVMATKEQKVTIPTQPAWSSGIYWIRITAPGVKNVYQGKVAIQ